MRFLKSKTNNDTRPNVLLEPLPLQKFQPNRFTKFIDKHADGRTQSLVINPALCRHCGVNTDSLL